MPERNWQLYIDDMYKSIQKILQYTKQVESDEFISNEIIFDAVLRNLQIIGEAVKKNPKDIRKKNPGIEWKKIAGLRDIIIHDYFGLDEDIIIDIVYKKIPELSISIKKYFNSRLKWNS